MARILITGAAGFIGSHTADLLLQEGHSVLGLDNFRTGRRENLERALRHPSFELAQADVAEPGRLGAAAASFRPQALIHLAALVSVPESIAKPEENERLNFGATRLVAEAARAHRIATIVFASSAAVYGGGAPLPVSEQAPCSPMSPYGEAKLRSEALLIEMAREGGPLVRCLRYFNVYGPRQDPSSAYSGVISRFAAAMAAGRPPTILGDGEQTRDFVYVGDAARANLLASTAPGRSPAVMNICTGRACSLNGLFAAMADAWGFRGAAVHAAPRPGDIRHSLGEPGRARREIGFTAVTTLEEGLRALRGPA